MELNAIAFPINETDDAILTVIEEEVLDPDFIDVVVESAYSSEREDVSSYRTERARVAGEVENLTRALAEGGDIPYLVKALRERDQRLRFLDAKLVPVENPSREQLRLALQQRVTSWREILRSNVQQGRMVLQHLFDGPIQVASNADRPEWTGQPRPEGLLAGMVQGLASPISASWNQLGRWLRAVDGLRRAA